MNERPVLGIGKLTASDRYWVIVLKKSGWGPRASGGWFVLNGLTGSGW